LSCGLESTADESENGGNEDAIDTANAICDPTADEAADDTSKIVLYGMLEGGIPFDRDNKPLTMLTMPPWVVVFVTVPSGRPMPTSSTYLGAALTPPMTP